MTKKTFAIIISLLVALMPFLGFPERFDTYFYLVSGLLLMGLIELISIQYYSRYRSHQEEDDFEELDVYNDSDDRDERERETTFERYVDNSEENDYETDMEEEHDIQHKTRSKK